MNPPSGVIIIKDQPTVQRIETTRAGCKASLSHEHCAFCLPGYGGHDFLTAHEIRAGQWSGTTSALADEAHRFR